MLKHNVHYKTISSPVGPLKLMASDKGLCAVLFSKGKHNDKMQFDGNMEQDDHHPILVKAEKQLAEYFSGKRKIFDIPLDIRGSVFQIKAWRELQKIPYGETIAYGEQAKRVGDAKKARAVGMANGRNPLSSSCPATASSARRAL
jgi:methylated-DNA-[protein]-cysteine S-methyltransferase